MTTAKARACANIALVKYWGKRPGTANLPATGSLSLTLGALATETTVAFDAALDADALWLDGEPADATRITEFLDIVRDRAKLTTRARVITRNEFPTASGLASSASGFAALAVAATHAAGLVLSPRELSLLARRGSGSAARSIFGGFVRMHASDLDTEAYAEPIASPLLDSVRMVIAIVGSGMPKQHASRDGMVHVAATSPLYASWLDVVPRDLYAAESALASGDLAALGELAEANALAMHATAIAARPAVIYWQPATLALLAAVRTLRGTGRSAWATIDAGPHVKVLTTAGDADHVARALAGVQGVTATTISAPGEGAMVLP
jgi:diphosphomevalonate decarboxylase